jgi:4-hydroxy-3-methylbut-2-enyl diphosphate reductase IspH
MQRLRELDIEIFEEDEGDQGKDYGRISEGDVVIFPAFGATVQVGAHASSLRQLARVAAGLDGSASSSSSSREGSGSSMPGQQRQ